MFSKLENKFFLVKKSFHIYIRDLDSVCFHLTMMLMMLKMKSAVGGDDDDDYDDVDDDNVVSVLPIFH